MYGSFRCKMHDAFCGTDVWVKWNSIFTANSIFHLNYANHLVCSMIWYGTCICQSSCCCFCVFFRLSFLSVRLFAWKKNGFALSLWFHTLTHLHTSLKSTSNRIISGWKFRLHVAHLIYATIYSISRRSANDGNRMPLFWPEILCAFVFIASKLLHDFLSINLSMWYANQPSIIRSSVVYGTHKTWNSRLYRW